MLLLPRPPFSLGLTSIAFGFAGAFPLWLAPIQCRLVPVNAAVADYVTSVSNDMRAAGIRVEVAAGV